VERIGKSTIVGCLMLCFSGLYAARPFATDDAGTVTQGMHELEVGIDFWSEEASLGLSFKHGLTDRMDIGVGIGRTLAPEEAAEFEKAELGMKFSIIPDFIAFSANGSFGHEEYFLNGIITRNVGPVEIDANLGYETDFTGDEEGTVIYSAAAIFSGNSYAFGAEISGDKDGFGYWLIGGRYFFIEGFAVDAGVAGGFEDDPMTTATAGIHYEF
jgi:hypothetical protein